MPAARLADTASGTKARVENSNRSSSIASTTAASGVPNVAAIPAARPARQEDLALGGGHADQLADQGAEGATGDDDRALGAERPAGADRDRGRCGLGDGGAGSD